MGRTASKAALLHVALQDLRAGKASLAERLPAIADAAADARLAASLSEEVALAEAAGRRLAEIGGGGGPDNLWMAGILDDADRDARSHQPGAILDIALIGAVRKAKAAEIVSFETAIALAGPTMAETLSSLREDAIVTDHRLRALLLALAA